MILTRILTCTALALTLAACGGSPSKPNAEASKILPTIGSSGGARSNIPVSYTHLTLPTIE